MIAAVVLYIRYTKGNLVDFNLESRQRGEKTLIEDLTQRLTQEEARENDQETNLITCYSPDSNCRFIVEHITSLFLTARSS